MNTLEWQWMLRHLRRQWPIRRTLREWQHSVIAWRRFWSSYQRYTHLAAEDQKPSLENLYPCIGDDTAFTAIEPTYFYQDAWAFEKIAQRRPTWHVDVGSHHKYVALLSKVVPVTMVDIRPLSLPLDTLTFRHGSILDLPFDDKSVPSVSSLCVVEHIGLGRYGDPLDALGTEKAIEELKRVVAPAGDLYLSIPLEVTNRIYFNAHRAFTETYLQRLFEPFEIVEKRYIYGNHFGYEIQQRFGTGCYHLRRI